MEAERPPASCIGPHSYVGDYAAGAGAAGHTTFATLWVWRVHGGSLVW